MNGGNNTSLGGSTWNTVRLWGDNNSYDGASLAAFGHPFREVDRHCVDYIHHVAR